MLWPLCFLKPALGWRRNRDANLVPSSLLADDLATAPSGPVMDHLSVSFIYSFHYLFCHLVSGMCFLDKNLGVFKHL